MPSTAARLLSTNMVKGARPYPALETGADRTVVYPHQSIGLTCTHTCVVRASSVPNKQHPRPLTPTWSTTTCPRTSNWGHVTVTPHPCEVPNQIDTSRSRHWFLMYTVSHGQRACCRALPALLCANSRITIGRSAPQLATGAQHRGGFGKAACSLAARARQSTAALNTSTSWSSDNPTGFDLVLLLSMACEASSRIASGVSRGV